MPRTRPAIGNLMTMFDFGHPDFATLKLPASGSHDPRRQRSRRSSASLADRVRCRRNRLRLTLDSGGPAKH